MVVTAIQLVSLPVTDQDRARDFYVDILGFELVSDTQMGPGMRWVQLRPPGATTSVTLVTWFATMAPGSTKGTVLETDDLDGELIRLRLSECSLTAMSRMRPGGGSSPSTTPTETGSCFSSPPPADREAVEGAGAVNGT
jgi:catechol 2,3-dioxygenase-like lactoylglutathione lyase family enzyme